MPEAVCYMRFGHAEVKNSTSYDRHTVRGEMLILDFDEAGRIVGIELVGAGKPCQDIPEDEGGIHAD